MKNKQKSPVSLWDLFITFFKIGAFTFGGGYAMVSVMEEELSAKKKWITSQDMLDMLVIAESTPGAIAVNTATSVGYRMHGIVGGIVATLGVVLPSFIIISALYFVIEQLADNYWYKAAFKGVNACVTVLVINAFVKMGKQLHHDAYSYICAAVAFVAATILPDYFAWFDVIYLIILGGILGVVIFLILRKQGKPLPLEAFAEAELVKGGADGETAALCDAAVVDDRQANVLADFDGENAAKSVIHNADVDQAAENAREVSTNGHSDGNLPKEDK